MLQSVQMVKRFFLLSIIVALQIGVSFSANNGNFSQQVNSEQPQLQPNETEGQIPSFNGGLGQACGLELDGKCIKYRDETDAAMICAHYVKAMRESTGIPTIRGKLAEFIQDAPRSVNNRCPKNSGLICCRLLVPLQPEYEFGGGVAADENDYDEDYVDYGAL